MAHKPETPQLTAALVARVHRQVADGGAPPGMVLHNDAEYDQWVARILRSNPAPGSPVQLFAAGSLIWKPEVDHMHERIAVARGWHRSFCLRNLRFRGTPDSPGLMMALDRGGQCKGALFALSPVDIEAQLGKLFRREFTFKPANNLPRWISVQVNGKAVTALAFVMNRASAHYAGRLPLAEVAEVLAVACGHVGSGAEYLLNTVNGLEARGIRDRNLWALQKLVALRIAALHGSL